MMALIHTANEKMRNVLALARQIAPTRSTVLITGASGTGKEMVARYIHNHSDRAGRQFLAVNCAALPEGLLESELFGFEKGAFTGALQARAGKFELADQGTFLLDEISEMPLRLQAKILRVIQESEVDRLGGRSAKRVNVRLIATSNRDLREMVARGEFREDLYYRLNVLPLKLPSLTDRGLDVEHLARHFVEELSAANQTPTKGLTESAIAKLLSWRWPGNVRELRNTLERAVVLSTGELIDDGDIHIEGFAPLTSESRIEPELSPGLTIQEAERLLILKTLEHTKNNRTHAADMLGISVRTLRNKIAEYRTAGWIDEEVRNG